MSTFSVRVEGAGSQSYIVVTEPASTSTAISTAATTTPATSNNDEPYGGDDDSTSEHTIFAIVFPLLGILVAIGLWWYKTRKATKTEREDQPYGPQADVHEPAYQRRPNGAAEMASDREREELDLEWMLPEMQTTREGGELDSRQTAAVVEAPSGYERR